MKRPTACPQCRAMKKKCVQNPTDLLSACISCRDRKIECSKPWVKRKSHSVVLRKKPETRPLAPSPDEEEFRNGGPRSASSNDLDDFVNLYLRLIHDRPHSLFHEETLLQQLRDQSVPESLLAAICALGCRLSPDVNHRNLAATFISKSKSLLAQQLEDISIPNIQTCILLANSYAAEQNNGLEALYFGIATRMAYVLRLHKQDPNDPLVLRETKCKIWWSLFMADRWCPPGLGLPREIMFSNPSIELPMDEVDFQMLRPTDIVLPSERRNGLWAYKITLVEILASIQDMNLSLVRERVDRLIIDNQVRRIVERLHEWHDSLPQDMVMNDHNLQSYRKKGCGGTFVSMHLGYHHYCTLLYFQYLEPDCQPTRDTAAYAARCRQHGLAFSRLLHTARELGDCHVVFLTIAHMTMVSSSVLLHLLLFGNDEEVETARLQLTRNFEALMDLSKHWPCVDQMKERLFIFQNACLCSSVAKTYTVDRWIVRFLLEYALPFEGKSARGDTTPTKSVTQNQDSGSTVPIERRIMLDKALEDLRG